MSPPVLEESPPSSRGVLAGLVSPRPIGAELPAVFQEDDFCQRFTGGLDEVLAPVFTTLDCLEAYLDPALAPEDFVDWLAGWVGVELDETWSRERRRRLVHEAVALYRRRGTPEGLSAHVELYAGVAPRLEESGGCSWSESANTPLPGSPRPHLAVVLEIGDEQVLNDRTLERIVAASRPAHLPFEVRVERRARRRRHEAAAGDREPGPEPETGPAEAAAAGTPPAGGGSAEADPGAPEPIDLPGAEQVILAPPQPAGEDGPVGERAGNEPGGGGDGPAPPGPTGAEPPEDRDG